MAKLIWTDAARGSLVDVHDYIARDNAEAAVRTIEGIYRKTEILQDFPRIGYLHRTTEEDEERFLLYGHYRIVYLVKTDAVVVTGVVHTARDLDRDDA